MRSRYNIDGSVDYEADREIEMLRHVDAELERLRRMEAEGGATPAFDSAESLFKPTVKLLKKAGHLNPPMDGMTEMTQLELFPMPGPMPESLRIPLAIQPAMGIPEFLKPKPKTKS